MSNSISFFSTSPKGIEPLLALELEQLGAESVKQTRAGVQFQGNLELAYRACLWLRTANRVLMPLNTFKAETPEDLYYRIREIDWIEHLEPDNTFAVDFQSFQSKITHTKYGALKVKDGIVDQFREKFGRRPSIDIETPDIRLNVYVLRNDVTIYLDFSGDSLHRRGYRTPGTAAPLKENLAAAILMRAGWPEIAAQGGGLVDPMCGSGTLPIEAALMAADSAPGLLRDYFGFLKWKQHDADTWNRLLDEAENRETKGFKNLPPIVGYDSDAKAISTAFECLDKAGLKGIVHFEKQELAGCRPSLKMQEQPGLCVINPPYGKRLGELDALKSLYAGLGQHLKDHFQNWHFSLFTGNLELGKQSGLRPQKQYTLYNGAIECKLLNFTINPDWYRSVPGINKSHQQPKIMPLKSDPDIDMFVNRLKKNLKKLKPWLKRENISCFRAYNKDIPEYAVSIDIYDKHVHVQEYKAPESIDLNKAASRLESVLAVLSEVLNVPVGNIFLKVRQQQKGKAQYQKQSSETIFHEVMEDKLRFLVNFTDYLDTGLFLDHRPTRQMIKKWAKGKRFLNLFAYTGTATVCAAAGGAKATTTVDMSNTYIKWAKRNLALNGYDTHRHRFHQSDCKTWIKEQNQRFDLVFLDPPTFSNAKKQNLTFDIQKDHVELINLVGGLLENNGILIFSNNYKRFRMDFKSLDQYQIVDITAKTIPDDFSRSPKIHNCWKITKKF